MQKKYLQEAEKYAKQNNRRRTWRKIVRVMACAVVFCTTYALILPAITMEKNPCDLEEHTHSESCYEKVVSDSVTTLACTYESLGVHVHTQDCYNSENVLICGQADYLIHEHNDDCLDENGAIVCQLPEVSAHVHTEACYRVVETEPVQTDAVHTHSDDCYGTERGGLICQLTETEGHTHGQSCFTQGPLICQLTETEGHTHGTACYESLLTCELSEEPAHQHTDACYEMLPVLICGLEDGAILTASTDTTEPERELICTEPVAQVHTHSAICYGTWELICGKEEHTHDLVCQNDPEADVETEADWIATFADVTLTGEWDEDLLSIARSQLGYQESTRNYEVMEDGETIKGYTRYGDWYGMPYGDWCAMFVSFCLNYAEIPQDAVPYEANCPGWIEALQNPDYNLYQHAGEYTPVPGDLIFFDREEDGAADHVGIVTEIIPATEEEPAKIKTIEGNMGDQVAEQEYDMDDVVILGYAQLPEKPLTYDCGLQEHTHDESCMDENGELICGIAEHTHTDECLSETVYSCGLQEHAHDESCTDENGELVCGLEEHTHSSACTLPRELNGADEIPLTRPLICTMEEHSHDSLCYGETDDGGLICDRIEHTHTSECYGPAVAEFSYEDDYISMDVTVTSNMGLPEEMSMEVLMLNTEDQHYTAYEGYAVENANGELLGLTGYQVRFFYEGQEIRLEDAEITAELTVKPVEYQTFVKSEDTESIETVAEGQSELFAEDSGSEEPALLSLSAEETAVVLLSSEESENGAEDGETPDSVIITVLQQSEDEIISQGSTTFSETENQSTQITLSLTGNTTFALARESVVSPEFTVQYYANFPRMQRYTLEERNKLPTNQLPYVLEIIDTSLDGDGDGGSLPQNGQGIGNPGTSKGVTYLHLRELPGVAAGADKLHVNDTSTNRHVYEVMTQLEQTQVYVNNSFTYYTGLGIHDIDALHENTHYNLVDLWIGKPGDDGDVDEWTVYTTVAVNAASYKEDGSDLTLKVDASVTNPTVSSDSNTVGQWMHDYGTDGTIDFNRPWYRKFRQTAAETDTTWINIPHGGNGQVTKIVRVADIHDLTFTNNEAYADTNTIYISSGDVIRLVHDLPRTDQSMAANLFDYDITDTKVYISKATDTSGTPVLEMPELLQGEYNSANQAMSLLTQGGYTSYYKKLYTKTTTGTSSSGYVAYGINSQEAYNKTTGAKAYLAFGNNNTGVFRANDQLNGLYINRANSANAVSNPSFKGCCFGLVKDKLANGQPFLSYADGIAHQALFNEEVLPGYSSPPGKTTYSRQQLVFRRMGDTYILTDVNRDIQGAKVKEDKLNQFTVSHERPDGSFIFTNNFWPMDGTIDDSTVGHDMKFGSIDAGTGGKERYYVGINNKGADSSTTLPVSDDSLAHNSYFGMTYSVEFQLDGRYCGPLEYLFYGDDDMWVYLTDVNNPSNSNLICDIGGVHSSVGSFTDLWDYIPKNTPGTYRLDFFYTERGASGSSCYMEFTLPNMASIPQIVPEYGSVRIKKEVPNATVDEEFTFLFELPDYTGDDIFATSHTDSTGKLLASAEIKNGGTFKLKAGEIISITGIPKDLNYRITEQLGKDQKYNVTWTKRGVTALDALNVVTGTVENGITHTYTCTNEALGSLNISKVVTGVEAEDIETDVAFKMLVTLTDADGNALNGTFGDFVFTNGQATVPVKHDKTVTLTGIPAGTRFVIVEQNTDGYLVSYKLDGNMVSGEDGLAAASVSGTIQYNKTASIQVVNTAGYELPQTGGAGTTTYTMAGLLMILLSTAYLMYRSKARRREVF